MKYNEIYVCVCAYLQVADGRCVVDLDVGGVGAGEHLAVAVPDH